MADRVKVGTVGLLVLLFIVFTPTAHATELGVTIKTQNIVQLTEANKYIDLIPKDAVWVRLEYAGVKYENGRLVPKNSEYDRLFWQVLHDLRQRGKKIWLVFGVPEGTTKDNYQKAIAAEMTLIPDLLPSVDVIQVGNEMDCHDFIGYKPIPGCNWKDYDGGAYIKRVLYFVEQVGEEVQRYNNSNWDGRHVGLAVNLTGWPLMNGRFAKEEEFVRQLSNYVDTVGLDLYPKDNGELIQYTTRIITEFKEKFPHVFVAETGMSAMKNPPKCSDIFTEEDQAKWLPAAIEAEKKANPEAIIVYMLQDIPSGGTDCHAVREAHFGLVREDGTKKPAYFAIFGGSAPHQSLKDALEKELHKWYPEKKEDTWELDVTKTVQKVYPDVVKANLSGTYEILDYWKVSADTFRTPEEIVKGWEEGYEIAKISINADDYPGLPEDAYGWYFVKVPAKLSVERAQQLPEIEIERGNGLAKIVHEFDGNYVYIPVMIKISGAPCHQYRDIDTMIAVSVNGNIRGQTYGTRLDPSSCSVQIFVNVGTVEEIDGGKTLTLQGILMRPKNGQWIPVLRSEESQVRVSVYKDRVQVAWEKKEEEKEEEKTSVQATITTHDCYENAPERMRPLGVGCVEYDVNVTPDDAEYNFVVYSASGKIIKEEQARGDRTFKITWPLNPTIPNYKDLVASCAEVWIDGNTVASTCNGSKQPVNKWNVKIESPYKYTYEIHGSTLHLTIYVNYTARNSCYGVKAVVEPMRCPNCYEVKIIEIKPAKNQICAEVIRNIPTVSVDIPLSNATSNVLIKITKAERGGTIPISPIICVKIEAKNTRIQQELRNCKISCTEEEKKRILEGISELREEAQKNGCKIHIPEPVFPKQQIEKQKPPEKPVPLKNPPEPQKPKTPTPQPKPHVPPLIQPIAQIWNNITRWLAILPRMW